MEKYVIKDFVRPGKEMVDEYRKLDVSTIYEAQGKQNIMDPELQPILSNTVIAGPAVTVTCQAGDNLMTVSYTHLTLPTMAVV